MLCNDYLLGLKLKLEYKLKASSEAFSVTVGFGGAEKRKGMEGIKNKESAKNILRAIEAWQCWICPVCLFFFFYFLNKFSYIVACSQWKTRFII